MSHDLWSVLAVWLVRVLAAGGAVLLITALMVRLVRQPARRQRIAEWGVAAALLIVPLCLVPAWLEIPLPTAEPTPVVQAPAPQPEKQPVQAEPPVMMFFAEEPINVAPEAPLVEVPDVQTVEKRTEPTPVVAGESVAVNAAMLPAVLVSLYLIMAAYFLLRLAWGYWRLNRFLASTLPAPHSLKTIFAAMDSKGVRLLVSSRLRVPLSCGIVRPTIVVPTTLCHPLRESELRWVLAHELSHLHRRDAFSLLLFGVARGVYFVLPWFWWLRRQTQLCQEYVADAAAAGVGPVEDYAEFLLHWSKAPAIPVGATGVSGHSSDLFRRVTMLVHNSLKIEESCPRRWSMLAAAMLLSVGVIAAGVGLTRAAAADEDKKADAQPAAKPDEKKDDKKSDKKDEKKPQKNDDLIPGFPDIDDLLKRLPPGLDDETMKTIRQQMEMTRKMMEQMRKRNGLGGIGGIGGGGMIPFPQIPNIPNIPQLGRLPGFPGTGMTETRLGAMLTKPSGAMVDQLDLPRDQGLVIEELRDDSAAAKAGLKRHDILLELDGKPVSSDPAEFLKQLSGVKADKAIDAVVMRKSKKETVKGLKLPEAKEQPGLPLQPLNPFNFQFNGFPGQGGITTISRNNDSFTAKNIEDGLTITVTGTIEEGKAKVSEISIDDGKKPQKYESVDKVPADHKAKVQSLIKAGEGGRIRNFRLGR